MRKKILWLGLGVLLVATFWLLVTRAPTTEPVGGFARIIPGVLRNELLIVDAPLGRLVDPGNFNHWRIGAAIGNGIHQMLADILWYLEPQTLKTINALAAGPPVYNEDFTQMTVNLRQGIYWSDGVPFTADDLVFTVNTLRKTPGMGLHEILKVQVKSVEKIDDHTVRFNLLSSLPAFHHLFTARVFSAMRMMPKHIMENVEDVVGFRNENPVSLGQYTLHSYDPLGFWWLFERRQDWERTSVGQLFGKPAPRYVLFIEYGDEEKNIIAQARHELDLIFDLTPEGWEVLRKKNPYSRVWYKEFPWAWMDDVRARKMAMSHQVYPFGIPEVRWALTLASDIVEIITAGFGGIGRLNPLDLAATAPLMQKFYEPLMPWLEEFELADGYRPWDSDIPYVLAEYGRSKYGVTIEEPAKVFGPGWWRYDPIQAAKLLEGQGFKRDRQGRWLLPDGTPWEISILAPVFEMHSKRLAFMVADQWERFGIDVTVDTAESGPFWARWSAGDFQVMSTWHTAATDLDAFIISYHSRFLIPPGEIATMNHIRWQNAEVDRIAEELELLLPGTPGTLELKKEYLRVNVKDMMSPTYVVNKKFSAQDHRIWTGFPSVENPYQAPVWWWAQFKFMLPFIELADN